MSKLKLNDLLERLDSIKRVIASAPKVRKEPEPIIQIKYTGLKKSLAVPVKESDWFRLDDLAYTLDLDHNSTFIELIEYTMNFRSFDRLERELEALSNSSEKDEREMVKRYYVPVDIVMGFDRLKGGGKWSIFDKMEAYIRLYIIDKGIKLEKAPAK